MIEADNEKRKYDVQYQNSLAHLYGRYMMEALDATVVNMFHKKTTKPHEYPEKPLEIKENKEMTEEEIQKQREVFMAKLMVMKTNYDLNHKGDKAK